MAAPTRLFFFRHGEVAAPHVGAFVGKTDVALSPVGHHQAEALAHYLEDAPLDAIVASPRRRALDTAAPLARRKGMKLDVRAAFAEMDFGHWDGLHWHEIMARDADGAVHWQGDVMGRPCPGGESGQAFADRVHAALEAVLEEFAGRTVAVAGHAGVSRAILSHALGMPYVRTFAFGADYGSLNAAAYGDWGRPEAAWSQVALVNFVPGPRSVDQGDGKREGAGEA